MSWRARYESHLLAALSGHGDPATALTRAADDSELPPALRRALAALDPNGVRISALLVVELRFERLLNGSTHANEWFQRDAAGFTRAFRAYHRAVPLIATHPRAEAAQFACWLDEEGLAAATSTRPPRP